MSNAALIFFGLLASFIVSWWTLVFAPHVQIGSNKAVDVDGMPYPKGLPGLAAQGRDVYVANGCVQCHSQQVQQNGYTFNVILTSAGTNSENAAKVLAPLVHDINVQDVLGKASDTSPQIILNHVSQREAEDTVAALKKVGAASQSVFVPLGPDITKSWGKRRSVARDYLYDNPVQVGNSRLGPDLADVGSRPKDANWHLLHLYHPRTVVDGSIMPAYKFLFEERPKGKQPSPGALSIPEKYAPKDKEVFPKPEALQLAAYLQSLNVNTPLFEAPATQLAPPPAPAGTNTAATNAPAATPAK